jgi:hypothetical protein
MRASIDLMTIFVTLNEHELLTTLVEMWSEVFAAWSAVHGRVDNESADQLGEYEEFLRASIWHLKQLRDAPPGELLDVRQGERAERILTGIFDDVARSIAFAERKVAGGKMPRRKESAVLGREELARLLNDDLAMLDSAIERQRH